MPDRKPVEKKRVVHLAEGKFSLRTSKMTTGVIRYGYHDSVAVVDSTQAGMTSKQVIGFGGDIPVVASIRESLQYGPEILLVGITPPGGRLTEELKQLLLQGIEAGLDIWAGLHDFLEDDADLSAEADRMGVRLWDMRRPRPNQIIGNARTRSMKSYIALAVGSDAAIGKMTACLEVNRGMQGRGIKSEFVATGQVGIAVAGWGSAVDAIPGDFMAGAVESDVMSCEGADIILVEGQGALLHPGFSSVTLGLLHGALPDGIILCHQVKREAISRIDQDIVIPPLDKVAKMYRDLVEPIKPTHLAACSLNTREVDEESARRAIEEAEALLGIPATDPVRFGPEKIIDALEQHRKKIGK